MATSVGSSSASYRPLWFWIIAGLGLAWNVFGLIQFGGSLTSTEESLMEAGMTATQAAVMKGYPTWMTIAFAIGKLGGTVGSGMLLLRSRYAVPVFWVSLVAYLVLFIGDYTQGVFAALGTPQVLILTFVILIAVLLLVITYRFAN